MGVIAKIRNLFVAIFLFYISPFISAFLALIKVQADPQIAWSNIATKLFNVKYHKLEGSKQQRKGKIIYLVNHRCQADFFIHNKILNANMNVLSRMIIAVVFPGFLFALNTIWFFNRSGNINPQKFNQWLAKKWQQSTRQAILVYPQGHRMQGATKCQKDKIKTGLIRFAYRNQAPVQLVMSFGNQQVFDEKRLHMAWNRDIYYSIGEVIDPKDFQTENDFVERSKERFSDYFSEIYLKYQRAISKQAKEE